MKSYTKNYIWQRITAIILLFLVPWFLWNLFQIKDLSHKEIAQNFNNLTYISLIFLMIVSGFYHGYLGINTICLDYLPNAKIRCIIMFLTNVLFTGLSVLAVFSLLKLGQLV